MTDLEYDNLDKRFIKSIYPYNHNVKRIPRKLKKKVKRYCKPFYKYLSVSQRLWQYLEKDNMKYKIFLTKIIIEKYKH